MVFSVFANTILYSRSVYNDGDIDDDDYGDNYDDNKDSGNDDDKGEDDKDSEDHSNYKNNKHTDCVAVSSWHSHSESMQFT